MTSEPSAPVSRTGRSNIPTSFRLDTPSVSRPKNIYPAISSNSSSIEAMSFQNSASNKNFNQGGAGINSPMSHGGARRHSLSVAVPSAKESQRTSISNNPSKSESQSLSGPSGPPPMLRAISHGASNAFNAVSNAAAAILRPGSRSTVASKQSADNSQGGTIFFGNSTVNVSQGFTQTGSVQGINGSGKRQKWRLDRTVMHPFLLHFLNPETEHEYERFFLERNLNTWKRSLQFVIVVCFMLYLYAMIAFPKLSQDWIRLYSDAIKRESGHTDKATSCPAGWYCLDCDPTSFCGIYDWFGDALFYLSGVLLPQTIAYLCATRMSSAQLARRIHLISLALADICLNVGLIIRFVVMEPRTSVYTSGLLLIVYMFLTHIFLRFRFIYALTSVTTCMIVYASANGWNLVEGHGTDGKAIVIVGGALFASSVVVCMYNYEWELTSRNQFYGAVNMHKANVKLTNQLKVLQRSYGNRAADFDSPLEKALMNLKSMMADPNMGGQHLILLSQTVALLNSHNLLAPDLENQEMHMDNEQEAWLFSEIARRKNRPRNSKRRTSLSFAQNSITETDIEPSLNRTRTRSQTSSPDEGQSEGSKNVLRTSPMDLEGGVAPGSPSIDGRDGDDVSPSIASSQKISETRSIKAPAYLENLSTTKEVLELLNRTPEYNFPIFDLSTLTSGKPLTAMSHHLFRKSGLFQHFDIPQDAFSNFITAIENGYHKDLPYHNSLHAADVLHATSHFVTLEPLNKITTELDLMAIYLAAIIHDYDHPGFSNIFLIAVGDPKAILYNDKAVLENHHLASSFAILNRPENNFLVNLSKPDYKSLRETVVDTVLATDLSQHFTLINSFKSKVANLDTFEPQESKEDRILMWKMVMKCADVSNPTKDISLYKDWATRVLDEMLLQGDKEKSLSLPVSPFMDRDTLNVPSSQIGFIEFVVFPLFDAFKKYVNAPHCLEGLDRNRTYWLGEKEKAAREKERSASLIMVAPNSPLTGGDGVNGSQKK